MKNCLTGVAFSIAALSYSAFANSHDAHSDKAGAQWDGVSQSETDQIVTLRLPAVPKSITLNGQPAISRFDPATRSVKVLVKSDSSGISCENSYRVEFADLPAGDLVANHCHGDSAFDIRAGEMIDERVIKDDVDNPDDDTGAPTPLAFEWSANGFIELDREFRWDGGITTQSYLSLAIPETDAFLLISSCSNGKVQNYIQMHSDTDALGGAKQFLVETDLSETMAYRADIVPMPEGDGGLDSVSPMVELAFDDPLFAALAAGNWAYFQMGSGDSAIKVRASLSGSARAINAFLAGC